MSHRTVVVDTFPSATIPSGAGGLPIEVSLIAQLAHGSGSHLVASVSARQRRHGEFIDELDEPSAKLAGVDFDKGDPTALYSFVVGPQGHPFHRHAGHRVFTAISGSGGAQLRFSTATMEMIEADPSSFVRALTCVNIPPDCMFTVRFGGETWHQFAPLASPSKHPVFFALSCHTNELGGELSEELRQDVLQNKATIPSLTALLPSAAQERLDEALARNGSLRQIDLSLDAAPGTAQRAACGVARGGAGRVLGAWGAWRGSRGFVSTSLSARSAGVVRLPAPPEGSLLRSELAERFHHEDSFEVALNLADMGETGLGASEILERALDGFLASQPASVARMMALRNLMARPIGLRTSSLGCPVSSLLSQDRDNLFQGKYPVFSQSVEQGGRRAQVILGANDKHLKFRSCVGVELDGETARITLGTRVECLNVFGRVYMAAIHHAHMLYVAPKMLAAAVEHAWTMGKPGS